MKTVRLHSWYSRVLFAGACVVGPASLMAQQAPASATAAQLAKYDANPNGRLDPDEFAKLQADERNAANAPGPAVDAVTVRKSAALPCRVGS